MGNKQLMLEITKEQENLAAIYKEIEESNDRAVGILCGSILDEQLKQMLKSFLVKDNKIEKEFLGGQGAISTFESRITACYYMGLIDEIERKNLEVIRKIRNKLAHSFGPIDFNTQSIKDLCNNLKIPIEKYLPSASEISITKIKSDHIIKLNLEALKKGYTPREKFIRTYNYLSVLFSLRNLEIFDKKLKKLEDNETTANKKRKSADKLERYLLEIIELRKENVRLLEIQKRNLENENIVEIDGKKKEDFNYDALLEEIELQSEGYDNSMKIYRKLIPIIKTNRRICELWNKEYENIRDIYIE
ncbi:hypothetical protein [Paraclostridium bifermentans]|uniref:hypothetical protein n=1 Tax=Paraclostridium bifermentans TaxID=1490 RepID=UPI001157FF5A|nr:hypothetical protein [Paraclostridium bifermentans]TQO56168.1 hypothetical protein D5S05_14825 [Paraclostridium bifermentans]